MNDTTAFDLRDGLRSTAQLTTVLARMKKTLDRIEKRQKLQDQHVEDLCRQVAFFADGNRPGGFTRFRRLPAELRNYIWELAIPKRIHKPTGRYEEDITCWSIPPPAVAQVCRESRSLALSLGILQPRMRPESIRWSWFSKGDILDLSEYENFPNFALEPPAVLASAESIIITGFSISWMADLVKRKAYRDAVKCIYIEAQSPILAEKSWWHPHLAMEFFEDNRSAFVDLEDEQDMKRFKRILERNIVNTSAGLRPPHSSRAHGDFFYFVESLLEDTELVNSFIMKRKLQIVAWWLKAEGVQDLPKNEFGHYCLEPESWETLLKHPSLPRIRFIQKFELVDIGDERIRFFSENPYVQETAIVDSESGLDNNSTNSEWSDDETVELNSDLFGLPTNTGANGLNNLTDPDGDSDDDNDDDDSEDGDWTETETWDDSSSEGSDHSNDADDSSDGRSDLSSEYESTATSQADSDGIPDMGLYTLFESFSGTTGLPLEDERG